jgi:hypothetical protein
MTKALGVFRLLFDILLPAKTTVGTLTVSKFYFEMYRECLAMMLFPKIVLDN